MTETGMLAAIRLPDAGHDSVRIDRYQHEALHAFLDHVFHDFDLLLNTVVDGGGHDDGFEAHVGAGFRDAGEEFHHIGVGRGS